MCTPLFLLYYLLPDPLWPGGLDRDPALLLILAIVFVFELARLVMGHDIPGMRPYERDRISAAAWAALGMSLTFLFFPLEYAAPVFLGMGWVDPLIGELRRRGSQSYPVLPAIVYFILALSAMSLLIGFGAVVLVASCVATFLAMTIERMGSRFVDDDFSMLIVPLVGIWFCFELLPI